ncbi:MAG: hypothetical protein AB1744_13255, partial [Candidatus Zixiibacteriota bacterium]
SLSKKVSEDLGAVPWLNMSYEGLRDSGEETRLEAFAEQVKAYARRSRPPRPVEKVLFASLRASDSGRGRGNLGCCRPTRSPRRPDQIGTPRDDGDRVF